MWAVGLKQRSLLWEKVKEQSEKERWISSSNAASVLYMHKYQSKQKLWRILHGLERRQRQDWNPAIEHGNKWEWAAIKEAKKWLPEVEEEDGTPLQWVRPGIVFDPFSPFCCSPDAVALLVASLFGLEVKCPYSKGVPKRVEDVDMAHVLQCFVCMHIMGATHWYLFYFDPYNRREGSSLWKVFRSQKLWDFLKAQGQELIEREIEPPRKNTKKFIEMQKWVLQELCIEPIPIPPRADKTPVQDPACPFPPASSGHSCSDSQSSESPIASGC